MTSHTPRDPAWRDRIQGSFDRQGAMRAMGARISHLEPGLCEIALPFSDAVSQQQGFFHGGVIGAIADSAAGYAGYSLMPADMEVLTTEYKINFVNPALGAWIVARGEVIKPGRTLTVTRADVFVAEGPHADGRKHCATLLQTLITVTPHAG